MVRRCIVVLSALIPVLVLACSDSTNPEQTSETEGECTESVCQIGTRLCDMEGRVRECIEDESGCGKLGEPTSCEEGLTCYSGECSEGPEVEWPETLGEDEENIRERGIGSVPVPYSPTIIPFKAFRAAFSGRDFAEAGEEEVHQAVELSAQANDIVNLGMTTRIQSSTRFEDDLFIVLVDPKVLPADEPQSGLVTRTQTESGAPETAQIQATDAFVVSGEMSGRTSWKASEGSFVVGQRSDSGTKSLPSRSCCSGEDGGIPEECREGGEGTGPFPCGEDIPCYSENLEERGGAFASDDDGVEPFRYQSAQAVAEASGENATRTGGLQPEECRQNRDGLLVSNSGNLPGTGDANGTRVCKPGGGYATALYVLPDREKLIARGDEKKGNKGDVTKEMGSVPPPGPGGGDGGFKPRPAYCDTCERVTCTSEPEPTEAEKTPQAQPDACGEGGSARAVPEYCKRIKRPERVPPECAGGCPGCYRPAGCPGGFRSAVRSGLKSMSSPPQNFGMNPTPGCALEKKGRDVPEYCKYVAKSPIWGQSCKCGEDCVRRFVEFQRELHHCDQRHSTTSAGVECTEDGVCMLIGANPSRGQKIKACVSCNSEGECERHTETEKDYGPQINKKYPEEGLAPVRTNSNNDEDEEEEEDPSQTDESDGSGEETEAKKEQSKNVESGGVEEKRPDGGKPTQPEESEQTTQGGDRHSVNTPPAEEAQSEESEAPNDNSSSNRTVRNESGPDEDPTGFSNDYLATPPTGSATQSDESTGSSDNDTNTGDDGSGQPSDVDGDPVRLATGAFTLSHTDLSYPGPAMSLRFQRRYTSRSDDRSVLGSNWTHNFDVRLTAVTPENAPSWAPEYCTGWSPQTTCAYVKYANGEKRLFYRDPGSDRFHIRGTVFVPQAGTTETLVRWPEDDGWVLRRPNGFKRYFNPQGRLTHLRDRFGNSITLRYEATPLYTAYVRYCRTDYFEKLYRTDNGSNLDPRFCRSLGVALGDRSMPEIREDTGWSTASSAAAGASPIKIPFDTPSHAQPFPTEQDTWFSDSPNSSEDYRRRLRRTRLYLVRLFNMGAMPSASTGQRKLRPVSATDDLGRTLEFDYHRDPTGEQFGLLKSVPGARRGKSRLLV